MSRLMRFPTAVKHDPAIDVWMQAHTGELGAIARKWFGVMRNCGDDVRELMHDGQATACVDDAAFAYVGVYSAHVNVGFYLGAQLTDLADPHGLLQGAGKFMRHVKIYPDAAVDEAALSELISVAYVDMKQRLR